MVGKKIIGRVNKARKRIKLRGCACERERACVCVRAFMCKRWCIFVFERESVSVWESVCFCVFVYVCEWESERECVREREECVCVFQEVEGVDRMFQIPVTTTNYMGTLCVIMWA